VGNQIEARMLRGSMACKEENHIVLRLGGHEFRKHRRRTQRKARVGASLESPERKKDVRFCGFLIQEGNNLDLRETLQTFLLTAQLSAEFLRVLLRPPQVIAIVGILVDAYGQYVDGASPFETLAASYKQCCILTLHIVAVEGICGQSILARENREGVFQRDLVAALEGISGPQLDERAIAEQADVAHAASRRMIL